MDGHFHGHGCHGSWRWRDTHPIAEDEILAHPAGFCRCGHGPHAYYDAGEGRLVRADEAAGKGGKLDRIAFLEYEVKILENCLERKTSELEKLKGEQGGENDG